MTSSPVIFKKIKSNNTSSDEYGNGNNDDFAISPIEGYSEVKMIPSPYSKKAHVDSSGESTPTASNDGSNENLMFMSISKISSSSSPTKLKNNILSPLSGSELETNNTLSVGIKTNFCNNIALNDIPQWKKDLISRRKNNIARTIEANQQNQSDITSSNIEISKTVNEEKSSTFLKKLSPISPTISTKSIILSSGELSSSSKIEIKSPVTVSSSSIHSFNSIKNSNQFKRPFNNNNNNNKKILSNAESIKNDVANDDLNQHSQNLSSSSSTSLVVEENQILSKGNNIITKNQQQKINKIESTSSSSANNELLLTNRNDLISTAIDNNNFNKNHQMPVKLLNSNVKSVANKYTENLTLNNSIQQSTLSSLQSPSSSSSSTSVVKTIIGKITSKGQYTKSNSNNMIDSSSTTLIKSEKLYLNKTNTTLTTPKTTILQQSELNKGISNRIGIQLIPQQQQENNSNKSNDCTTTMQENPPIPKRRTSLKQFQPQLQKQAEHMATSLPVVQKSCNNNNTIKKSALEMELQLEQQIQQQQIEKHMEVQQQYNIPSKEIEGKEENDKIQKQQLQQQQQSNLLLTNQLHSRYESVKIGVNTCADVNQIASKQKNSFNNIESKNLLSYSFNTDHNLTTAAINIAAINSNESIIKNINKNNNGDGGDVDENDGVGNNIIIDDDALTSSSSLLKLKSENLIDNSNKFKNNNIISDDKIIINNDTNEKKFITARTPTTTTKSIKNSQLISQAQSNLSNKNQHQGGYIKNPTVNKNSTATINKYIAAANATASGIKNNQTSTSSPKNLILLNNNNSVLTTTTPTSSLPSSSASTLLLFSNNKNKEEFNSNNFIKNKMVAVQEIQLKSSSSIATTPQQQQIATTNGESSSTINGGDSSSSSVTTTINNLKTTTAIPATNHNNNKRTKMINNIKNNKINNKDINTNNDNENENDEFNDFDPSEELQYGPGIVSKLRCRYLSLALRQSTGKQRLPLDNLRRATSLNNLLDGSSNNGGVGPTIVGKSNKILNGGACGNSNGAYNSTTNSTTNGITIKSNYLKNHNNGKTNLNQMIIDEDNDYEDLIISSNHNHYINNKKHQQNGFNSTSSTSSSSSKEFQQEKERENSCSLYTASAAIITNDNDDINFPLSSSATTNELVEKPDYQQQSEEQQNSFTSNNKKSTSAAIAAGSGHIGKNHVVVSAIIAEKNKTISNQYKRNTTTSGNTTTTSSAAAAAAAAGIIRSGRQIKRGNDSIKRARSVEALLCEKPDLWTVNNSSGDDTLDNDINNCSNTNNSNINVDVDQLSKQKDNSNNIMSVSAHAALHWNNTTNTNTNNLLSPTNGNGSPILNEVTIEHKITNAREQRKHEKHPPKRLTSVIDDTERPPPDVVKQTLKIFEAGANRRGGRGLSKNHQSGHVAMKVANYKSIISQDQPNNQKPPISYPKPPLSPKRLNSLNGNTGNGITNINGGQNIKTKPNTLNIQNGNTNNNKKYNKNSPKTVGSPVSNLTKRFNSQSSTEDSIEQQNMSNNSSKSSTPTLQFTNNCGITSPTTIGHLSYSMKNRNESTPVARITTPTIQQQPQIRAPDIIPRKIFDNNLGISPVVHTGTTTTTTNGASGSGEGFDSPITQLTKRIDRLKLETPPPPPTSSSTSSGVCSQTTATTTVVQNDQSSVKSSESESTDHEDDFNSYDVTLPHDDDYYYEDDDDDNDSIDGDDKVIEKKISKAALENISKAGSSQCFSFKNVKTTPLIGTKSSNLVSNVEQTTSTTVPIPAPKQVGIIRPLVAEPKLLNNDNDDDNSVVLKSYNQTQDNLVAPPQPLKRNSILTDTDTNVVIGTRTDNSSASNDNNLVIANLSQKQATKSNDKLLGVATSISNTAKLNNLESNSSIEQRNIKPALTSREIEKNLINEKKNELANLENYGGNATAAATTSSTTTTTTSNNISSNSNNNTNNNNSNELQNWQQQLSQKKKNSNNYGNSAGGPIEASNNIMVFNFKDRKEVPDYIENDGLFIKRKRELPKPNESGFVLLCDLSLETSTDPDDSWTMGPPSPCNVEFENANIIIDGKSSLRFRSKDGSLRVQFDDTLTSTFEYPSESSLLDDYVMTPTDNFYIESSSNPIDTIDNNKSNHHVQIEEIIPVVTPIQSSTTTPTTTKSLGNMPIGSVPLGNYTPVKVQLQRHFELGVTRVPNAIDGQSVSDFLLNEQQQQSQQQQNGHSNNKNNSSINSSIKTSSTNEYNNKKSTNGIFSDTIINNDNDHNDDDDDKLLQQESDSLQYLKPATDDLTVVYSEGTQKTDLLY